MSIQKIQAWLQSLIGQVHGRSKIATATVEFGADGFGIILVCWQPPGDQDGSC